MIAAGEHIRGPARCVLAWEGNLSRSERDVQLIPTVICDDEPAARDGLRMLLASDPDIVLVGTAADGREAVDVISATAPELVFLDVQMPEGNGFAVIERLPGASGGVAPTVVFVTAFDEFALRAFEVHAIDYLLKPFSDARFRDALNTAKTAVHQRRMGAIGQQLAMLSGVLHGGAGISAPAPAIPATDLNPVRTAPRMRERVSVRTGTTTVLVPVADIDWIEADDYYSRLHVGGRSHLLRESMSRLAATLDPGRFIRVHRSAIVNVDRVQSMQGGAGGRPVVVLLDGTTIPISRSRRAAFARALGAGAAP